MTKTSFYSDDNQKIEGDVVKDFLPGGKYEHVNVVVTTSEHVHGLAFGDLDLSTTSQVWFNPFEGLELLPHKEPGYFEQLYGRISPTVILSHKLAHIWNWRTNANRMRLMSSVYT